MTIPKEVREFLGLQAGDGVRFEIRGDEVIVRPFRRQNLESLLGSLGSTVPYRGREAEREAMEAGMAAELVRRLEPIRQ